MEALLNNHSPPGNTGHGSRSNTRYRRIGIIGDVHAENAHLQSAIETLKGEEPCVILCTGDIADGTGDLAACCRLLRQAGVLTVRGNHDRWCLTNRVRHVANAHAPEELDASTREFLHNLPTTRTVDTIAGRLMLCHGMGDNDLTKVWPGSERMPAERSRTLDKLIEDGNFRFVVNGHMHYRNVLHFHDLTLVNAGTLRNTHRPGFALLDFDTLTVQPWSLESGSPSPLDRQPLSQPALWHNTRDFPKSYDGQWQPTTLY